MKSRRSAVRSKAVLAAWVVWSVAAMAAAQAQAWRIVPSAARFARAGAAEVTLEIHQQGGGACGGGGCTSGVEIRNVRGALPSRSLSYYYYSDRPGANPGCLGPTMADLFSDWSEAVIAPAAGTEADRPSCGLGFLVGSDMHYWVILRVRRIAATATARPSR